jgi:DnaK suppressor protein
MTNDQIEELRKKMEDKLSETETSVAYLTGETKAIEPSVSLGRLTRMEAISEKGVNEYVLADSRRTLERLRNALERVEKGTYGRCIRCGEEIPFGRLQHVPEALLCVPCAEKKR